uniref:Uncharacterized protein n=1 Tax=Cynoglossus semilaevis TaxID=244447 RepID=A0A3P8VMN6_CYNSE
MIWFVDLRQELLAGLVCLQLVNVLHKNTLILEHITLGLQVEAVIPGESREDLKGRSFANISEQWLKWPVGTTQDPHATHPNQFLCSPLTNTHVSSLAACQCVLAAAGPGVDRDRFADDKTILDQFTDLLTYTQTQAIGISDFIGLVRIQPDLLFTTAENAGGQPLLKP